MTDDDVAAIIREHMPRPEQEPAPSTDDALPAPEPEPIDPIALADRIFRNQ